MMSQGFAFNTWIVLVLLAFLVGNFVLLLSLLRQEKGKSKEPQQTQKTKQTQKPKQKQKPKQIQEPTEIKSVADFIEPIRKDKLFAYLEYAFKYYLHNSSVYTKEVLEE